MRVKSFVDNYKKLNQELVCPAVLPYSLEVKLFMDFGVPTKILALKILFYSIIQCRYFSNPRKVYHSTKTVTLKIFRLYGTFVVHKKLSTKTVNL